MKDIIIQKIVECATNRIKKNEVAKELNYSSKQLTRFCKTLFNRTYKKLEQFLVCSKILQLKYNGNSHQAIADELFNGDTPQLSAYIKKHFINIPLEQISFEGGNNMTTAQQQILEGKVISMLATNPTKNLTLKQLGVPRSIIVSLREKGFPIISVPGRYNSGYNLGHTSKDNCLSWINNVRINRYGLSGNYSF